MYQDPGFDDGTAHILGSPEMFGLTFEETELEGLAVL
jgi:hypothetical protein